MASVCSSSVGARWRKRPGVSDSLRVREAFPFGLGQRLFLDEQALPLVAFARPAPFEHDGREPRMLLRAPGQRRVTRGQKDQMIQIGARQAQRSFVPGQRDPGMMPEFPLALTAFRFPGGDEDLKWLGLLADTRGHSPLGPQEGVFPVGLRGSALILPSPGGRRVFRMTKSNRDGS